MIYNAVFLPSLQRTTTQTSADLLAFGGDVPTVRGVQVVLDITVNAGGSGNLTITINGKDPASGKYYLLLSSAVLSAVATTVFRVYPGLTAATNLTVSDNIPVNFQIVATVGNANPVTYSIGYNLLV